MKNLIKIKSLEVRPEIVETIKFHASENLSGLFDKKFPEEAQGSGYHSFKQMVLEKTPLPVLKDKANYTYTGYYMSRLHPNIRARAIECAKIIRKQFKIYNDDY